MVLSRLFGLLLLFPVEHVWAATVIRCDPTAAVPNRVSSYESSVSEPIPTDPNVLRLTSPPSHPWDGSVPTGNRAYWKCVDADADGRLDRVVEMTASEKNVIDQPAKDAKAKRDALETEAASNAICTKTTLAELDAYIETALPTPATLQGLRDQVAMVLKAMARCELTRASKGQP